MILQRPFNFEKYELTMSSIEKIDVKLKLYKFFYSEMGNRLKITNDYDYD
jgi:hypothetical protein